MCVVGWSEPTPEQVAVRTNLLFKAIESDNVEQAKLCIKTGADINGKIVYRDNKYITPLLYAVQKNRIEIVKLLINAKVDMNASIPEFGHTPITLAAQSGYTDIVNLLIKSGLDVNAKNYSGETAIMHVYDKNNMAELLIKLGADVNAKDNNGSTALYFANYKSKDRFLKPKEGIIAQLLAAGARE